MSEHVKQARIVKPATKAALSHSNDDHPVKLGGCTEIKSGMERHRTGIWYCPEASYDQPETWGDRKFSPGDRLHEMAKPQDTGK